MSEMVTSAATQIFQQMLESQGTAQQPAKSGKSFEQYLQQDQTLQTQEVEKVTPTQTVEKTQSTSNVDLQSKLNQLELDLSKKMQKSSQIPDDISKMMPDLTDAKTRLSLLKEAYSKVGNTSKVTSDLPGRMQQVEGEYKQVEEIMRSEKNLSQGELLALQARLYQVSQHIEVMSKVVDQMAGGIKTVLNTNI
jgi:hypothetical protein